MKEACADCVYYLTIDNGGGPPLGICRNSPPQWASQTWSFPGMQPVGWCGQFETKEEYLERKENNAARRRLRGEIGIVRPLAEGRGQEGGERSPDSPLPMRKEGERE